MGARKIIEDFRDLLRGLTLSQANDLFRQISCTANPEYGGMCAVNCILNDVEKILTNGHSHQVLKKLDRGDTPKKLQGAVIHGHECPRSPDGICHYESEAEEGEHKDGDGEVIGADRHGWTFFYVKLLDGTKFPLPMVYDAAQHDYETEDSCIFCGEPEERK